MYHSPDIQTFLKLSIHALERMYIDHLSLFCFRSYLGSHGNLILDRTSARYSIMSLIGLFKARRFGYISRINISQTLDRLVSSHLSDLLYGDTGLLLWADSI